MEGTRFSDIGKEEAIRRLLEKVHSEPSGSSSFAPRNGSKVVSASQIFMEGTDFDLVYFPLKHLGYKCCTAVLGEICSAFAHPRTLDARIGLSGKLDFDQVEELWSGMVTAAREHGVESYSLDLLPSHNGLQISISASGEEFLLTSKRLPAPKSKDLICIAGCPGAAFLGLQVLEKGRAEFEKTSRQPDLKKYQMLVSAYLKPEISPDIPGRFEEEEIYPSCGLLVTDGLASAIMRLCRKTGLGAKVYTSNIPFEGNSFEAGKELGIDPVSASMNGGNDYIPLFTVPIAEAEKFRREFQNFNIIGHLALPEAGAVMVTPEGAELPLHAPGYGSLDDALSEEGDFSL